MLKTVVHLNRPETTDRTAWLQLATPSDHGGDEAGDACVSELRMKDTVMTQAPGAMQDLPHWYKCVVAGPGEPVSTSDPVPTPPPLQSRPLVRNASTASQMCIDWTARKLINIARILMTL